MEIAINFMNTKESKSINLINRYYYHIIKKYLLI